MLRWKSGSIEYHVKAPLVDGSLAAMSHRSQRQVTTIRPSGQHGYGEAKVLRTSDGVRVVHPAGAGLLICSIKHIQASTPSRADSAGIIHLHSQHALGTEIMALTISRKRAVTRSDTRTSVEPDVDGGDARVGEERPVHAAESHVEGGDVGGIGRQGQAAGLEQLPHVREGHDRHACHRAAERQERGQRVSVGENLEAVTWMRLCRRGMGGWGEMGLRRRRARPPPHL